MTTSAVNSVLDLGVMPPRMMASKYFTLDLPADSVLRPASPLLTVEPTHVEKGLTRIRLQVSPQMLEENTLILTSINLEDTTGKRRLLVRGSVRAGALPCFPIIRVPQDAATLRDAIAFANPGDTLELSSGEWDAGVEIRKPLIIQAAEGGKVILRSAQGPTLSLYADTRLRGIGLRHEGKGCALYCEGVRCLVEHSQVVSGEGKGIVLAKQSHAALQGVEVANCRETGITVTEKSTIHIENSTIHHNRRSNMKCEPGTTALVVRSSFQFCKSGSGIVTQGVLKMEYSSLFSNAVWGVYLGAGAEATIRQGTFAENGRGSIHAEANSMIFVDKVGFPNNAPERGIESAPGSRVTICKE